MVKDTMKVMLANGKLPPLPQGLEDLSNKVQVSIDPHRGIHAMVAVMQGMAQLFSIIVIAAGHNATARPVLTSDNPITWFDPSIPFSEKTPFTIHVQEGPAPTFYPESHTLALCGSPESTEK